MLKSADIRKAFLDFFANNGHEVRRSSNLITNDKSLLFVNSGMVPFKKYFLNEDIPLHSTITSAQKSLRVSGKHNDLDQVGFTKRHHTFFEMLGNFSFGEYFKEEAICYAWEFLTKILSLDPKKLYITVFSEDQEAFDLWKKLTNFEDSKIIKISTSDNFWSMGDTGPCGPCSEIFYDHGDKFPGDIPGSGNELDRYIEIWNLVFMQKNKIDSNTMLDLEKKCIDTGMGLERITSIMNGTPDNYETDLFTGIIDDAFCCLGGEDKSNPAYRVIADHIRSSAFLLSEGLLPSNEGRGYVLRRILRRAINYMYKINQEKSLHKIAESFIGRFSDVFIELSQNKEFILNAITTEENLFKESYFNGFKILSKELEKTSHITGDLAFKLYDTYGFPIDVTCNIVSSVTNGNVDIEGFNDLMARQKAQSKNGLKMLGEEVNFDDLLKDMKGKNLPIQETQFLGYDKTEIEDVCVAAVYSGGTFVEKLHAGEKGVVICDKTVFYAESGGQVSDKGTISHESFCASVHSVKKQDGIFLHFIDVEKGTLSVHEKIEMRCDKTYRKRVSANHTATHMLHKVLREELGAFVTQHGSLVSGEKLRFDFNYAKPLERDLIQKIEKRVNDLIIKNCPVKTEVTDYDKAVSEGAMALFGEKYSDTVRVVAIESEACEFASKELCGGLHAEHTLDLGAFKILSESSIAAGIRRIEAITSNEVLNHCNAMEETINKIVDMLGVDAQSIVSKLGNILSENQRLASENNHFKIEQSVRNAKTQELNGVNLVFCFLEKFDQKISRTISDRCLQKNSHNSIIIIANQNDAKISLSVALSKDLQHNLNAKNILLKIINNFGCNSCGGRLDFAQGGVNLLNTQSPMIAMLCCDTHKVSERENNLFNTIKASIFA